MPHIVLILYFLLNKITLSKLSSVMGASMLVLVGVAVPPVHDASLWINDFLLFNGRLLHSPILVLFTNLLLLLIVLMLLRLLLALYY
jgi:hypothetical protein